MHRKGTAGFGDQEGTELVGAQHAVVLVGEEARDHQHIESLLSADVIVILLPSLQTAHFLLPGEGRASVAGPPTATAGDLRIDLTKHRVSWGRRELRVSERELAILATLSAETGRARTFAELAEPAGGRWLGDTELR